MKKARPLLGSGEVGGERQSRGSLVILKIYSHFPCSSCLSQYQQIFIGYHIQLENELLKVADVLF